MDKMMQALQTQLEFLVDDEENKAVSFGRIEGENAFGIEFEDGSSFFLTVVEA